MLKYAVTFSLIALPLAAQTPPAAPPAAPAVRQKLPDDSLQIARKYAGWVWATQADSIMAHQPPDQRNPQRRQEFIDMMAQISAQAGTEQSLVSEQWVRRNGQRQYWRVVRMTEFADEPVVLRIVILPTGEWGGIGLNPLSRVPPTDPEP